MHGGGKGEIVPYLTYLLLQGSLFLIWYSTGGLRGVYMHGGGKGEILPYLTYLLHLLLQGSLFLIWYSTGGLRGVYIHGWEGRNPAISDIPIASVASRQSVSHLVLYWRVEGIYMHGGGKGEILPYLTYLLHLLLQGSLFLIWYSTGGLRGVYIHGVGREKSCHI